MNYILFSQLLFPVTVIVVLLFMRVFASAIVDIDIALSRFAPLLQYASCDVFYEEQRLPIAALHNSDPCVRPSIRALLLFCPCGRSGGG